jgi:hypothetical protein
MSTTIVRPGTLVAFVGMMSVSTAAHSQEAQPQVASDVPPARAGFQMALRTGYALPLGDFDGEPNAAMSQIYSGQVPFIFDIGGKLTENVFLGGYLGLGIGGTGSMFDAVCGQSGATCATATFRLGIETHYQFLPAAFSNPWLGYGIGIESSAAGVSQGGRDLTFSGTGFEFAHFLGGVDFRLSRAFGLGPFVDFSLGQYDRARIDLGTGTAVDGSIATKAMHEWLAFGVRAVLFP